MFGLTKYRCLGCGESFWVKEAKRYQSNCPRCLTPVEAYAALPVFQGGPTQLIRIYYPSFMADIKTKIMREENELFPLGWCKKTVTEVSIESRYWHLATVIYVRDGGGQNVSTPFSYAEQQMAGEIAVSKTTSAIFLFTDGGEKKFRMKAEEMAKGGWIIKDLFLDYRRIIVFVNYELL